MFWNRKSAARLNAELAEAVVKANANREVRNWLLEENSLFKLVLDECIFRKGPSQLEVRIYSRVEKDGFLITFAFVSDQITREAVRGLWMTVKDTTFEIQDTSGQFKSSAFGDLIVSSRETSLRAPQLVSRLK